MDPELYILGRGGGVIALWLLKPKVIKGCLVLHQIEVKVQQEMVNSKHINLLLIQLIIIANLKVVVTNTLGFFVLDESGRDPCT